MLNLLSIGLLLLFNLFSEPNTIKNNSIDNAELCEPINNTFSEGEELTYKLFYNWNFVWVSAGEVVFKVEDKGENYKFTARGRTYSSYDWFFKADDYFESVVNKNSLLPVSFKREIKENKYRYYERIEFDRNGNKLNSWTGKSAETAKLSNHTLSGCTRDILAMIYAVRVQDFESLKSGSNVPINIFLDNKAYNLNLQFMGKRDEKRIHSLGKQKAYHLSPETIAGTVFKEKDRMNIWASTDENKIPLMIESPVSVGSVKAILIKHKGVKHAFKLSKEP